MYQCIDLLWPFLSKILFPSHLQSNLRRLQIFLTTYFIRFFQNIWIDFVNKISFVLVKSFPYIIVNFIIITTDTVGINAFGINTPDAKDKTTVETKYGFILELSTRLSILLSIVDNSQNILRKCGIFVNCLRSWSSRSQLKEFDL